MSHTIAGRDALLILITTVGLMALGAAIHRLRSERPSRASMPLAHLIMSVAMIEMLVVRPTQYELIAGLLGCWIATVYWLYHAVIDLRPGAWQAHGQMAATFCGMACMYFVELTASATGSEDNMFGAQMSTIAVAARSSATGIAHAASTVGVVVIVGTYVYARLNLAVSRLRARGLPGREQTSSVRRSLCIDSLCLCTMTGATTFMLITLA